MQHGRYEVQGMGRIMRRHRRFSTGAHPSDRFSKLRGPAAPQPSFLAGDGFQRLGRCMLGPFCFTVKDSRCKLRFTEEIVAGRRARLPCPVGSVSRSCTDLPPAARQRTHELRDEVRASRSNHQRPSSNLLGPDARHRRPSPRSSAFQPALCSRGHRRTRDGTATPVPHRTSSPRRSARLRRI